MHNTNSSTKISLTMKILAYLALLGLCACSPGTPTTEAPETQNSAFLIESGPDDMGFARIYVIQHKQTKRRFIFMDRSSGGIFLTPLE